MKDAFSPSSEASKISNSHNDSTSHSMSKKLDDAIGSLKSKDAPSKNKFNEHEHIRKARENAAKKGPAIETLSLKSDKKGPKLEKENQGPQNIFELAAEIQRKESAQALAQAPNLQLQESALANALSVNSSDINSQIQVLIDKLVETVSYMRSKNLEQLTLNFQDSTLLDGAHMNLKIESGNCLIQFLSLSEKSFDIMNQEKQGLIDTLSSKVPNLQIDQIHLEKRAETITHTDPRSPFSSSDKEKGSQDQESDEQKRQKQQKR